METTLNMVDRLHQALKRKLLQSTIDSRFTKRYKMSGKDFKPLPKKIRQKLAPNTIYHKTLLLSAHLMEDLHLKNPWVL